MQKATYTRLAKALMVVGGNSGFVKKSQSELESKVIDFVSTSLKHYKDTRDSNHVCNGAVALTQFNSRWLNAYYKAAKDLLAIHKAFELTTAKDSKGDEKFLIKHGKIDKANRPQHLPSIDRTTREMIEAWKQLSQPKPARTSEQQAQSAIKRTITGMFDFEGQREAVAHMGIEDLRAMITFKEDIATRCRKLLEEKLPKAAKPKVKAKAKPKAKVKAKVRAKAKPKAKATGSVGKALEEAAKAA